MPTEISWFKVNSNSIFLTSWLCHTLGLRHTSVHQIIDMPQENYTIIQLRSFNHIGSPGYYDIAVAGHVIENNTPLYTIENELFEELGVKTTNFINEKIEFIGTYEHKIENHFPHHLEIELRYLYYSKLNREGLSSIRFCDKEVAAILIISINEIQNLIRYKKDNIASGLLYSFPFYLKKIQNC